MKAICVAFFVFLSAVFTGDADAARQSINIGTGSVTSVYYPTGGAICRLMNRYRREHGIRCTVMSSGGSIDNLKAIKEGRFEFGVVQSDLLYHAFSGTAQFAEKGGNKELRAVFSMHPESLTIVARADARIRSLRDLAGKRINIGRRGSTEREAMDAVMRAFGWTTRNFRLAAELPSNEQTLALKYGKIDAAVFIVAHPSGEIKEITSSCDAVIIPVAGSEIERMVRGTTYYRSAVIPGGIYCKNDQDIQTFGVAAVLTTSARVPEKVVYHLVQAVFRNIDQFRKLHPAFINLEPVEMINECISAPLHDGARRYFHERGLR